MKIYYKRPFAQFVKKSRKPLQLVIEDKVILVCKNPELGKQKLGDLHDLFIYKFRFNSQEYLMAYKYGLNENNLEILWIDFYKIGCHENFYSELKKFIH
ncbi:MAG: type II toxin-antitoxin system RelE/ParE family toxin [Polynucleobacter sp.]